MSIQAPLTYGQLSTWRSIETFATDRLSEVNVPVTWDVRGFDAAAIRGAMRVLVARHESLRTTYHVVDGQPVQRVHPDAPQRIEQIDYADEPNTAERVTTELYQRALPVLADPGWHGVLGTSAGQPSFLALSLSHMVVDVAATVELEAQFRSLLTGSVDEAQAGPAPRVLAQLQREDGWISRRRGAEKYWRRLLTDGPVRNLAEPPPRARQRRIEATLQSHQLTILAAQAAAKHGVSAQSVVMAMTAAALGHLVGRRRVVLSMMSANRFERQWQPVVSTMNQLVPLVCDIDPDLPLDRYLKRVHLNALLAYRYGSYDVDRAAAWSAEAAGPDGTRFEHDCWFNYVPEPEHRLAGIVGQPPAATCTWTAPRRHEGHPFYVRVNSDGRSWLRVGLRTDPDLVDEADVVRALRLVALGVLRSATEPDARLGALVDDPGELPATIFPREVPELV